MADRIRSDYQLADRIRSDYQLELSIAPRLPQADADSPRKRTKTEIDNTVARRRRAMQLYRSLSFCAELALCDNFDAGDVLKKIGSLMEDTCHLRPMYLTVFSQERKRADQKESHYKQKASKLLKENEIYRETFGDIEYVTHSNGATSIKFREPTKP